MNKRKGLILAGGKGTRLYPVTIAVSKQLLPIYDKPMIYYPLSTLMLTGIEDYLIITTPEDHDQFIRTLGDGSIWGINIQYAIQDSPKGLADAFIIGNDFIGNDDSVLILGDNIFYGHELQILLDRASARTQGATVFGYEVSDPQRYGIVELDKDGKAKGLVEKPTEPKSNYAITGLYFYDNAVVDIASSLSPSTRGELEITDVNLVYMKNNDLNVELLGRGTAWLDTGTHESMVNATEYVRVMEQRQGLKICCPEEIAFRMGFIDHEQLLKIAHTLNNKDYGKYLESLVQQ